MWKMEWNILFSLQKSIYFNLTLSFLLLSMLLNLFQLNFIATAFLNWFLINRLFPVWFIEVNRWIKRLNFIIIMYIFSYGMFFNIRICFRTFRRWTIIFIIIIYVLIWSLCIHWLNLWNNFLLVLKLIY